MNEWIFFIPRFYTHSLESDQLPKELKPHSPNVILSIHQNSTNSLYDLNHTHHVLKNVKGATISPAMGGRATEHKD